MASPLAPAISTLGEAQELRSRASADVLSAGIASALKSATALQGSQQYAESFATAILASQSASFQQASAVTVALPVDVRPAQLPNIQLQGPATSGYQLPVDIQRNLPPQLAHQYPQHSPEVDRAQPCVVLSQPTPRPLLQPANPAPETQAGAGQLAELPHTLINGFDLTAALAAAFPQQGAGVTQAAGATPSGLPLPPLGATASVASLPLPLGLSDLGPPTAPAALPGPASLTAQAQLPPFAGATNTVAPGSVGPTASTPGTLPFPASLFDSASLPAAPALFTTGIPGLAALLNPSAFPGLPALFTSTQALAPGPASATASVAGAAPPAASAALHAAGPHMMPASSPASLPLPLPLPQLGTTQQPLSAVPAPVAPAAALLMPLVTGTTEEQGGAKRPLEVQQVPGNRRSDGGSPQEPQAKRARSGIVPDGADASATAAPAASLAESLSLQASRGWDISLAALTAALGHQAGSGLYGFPPQTSATVAPAGMASNPDTKLAVLDGEAQPPGLGPSAVAADAVAHISGLLGGTMPLAPQSTAALLAALAPGAAGAHAADLSGATQADKPAAGAAAQSAVVLATATGAAPAASSIDAGIAALAALTAASNGPLAAAPDPCPAAAAPASPGPMMSAFQAVAAAAPGEWHPGMPVPTCRRSTRSPARKGSRSANPGLLQALSGETAPSSPLSRRGSGVSAAATAPAAGAPSAGAPTTGGVAAAALPATATASTAGTAEAGAAAAAEGASGLQTSPSADLRRLGLAELAEAAAMLELKRAAGGAGVVAPKPAARPPGTGSPTPREEDGGAAPGAQPPARGRSVSGGGASLGPIMDMVVANGGAAAAAALWPQPLPVAPAPAAGPQPRPGDLQLALLAPSAVMLLEAPQHSANGTANGAANGHAQGHESDGGSGSQGRMDTEDGEGDGFGLEGDGDGSAGGSGTGGKGSLTERYRAVLKASAAQQKARGSGGGAATRLDADKQRNLLRNGSCARMAAITKERLQQVYHLNIEEAARELGIGMTKLKEHCRTLGIPRWPSRKLKSMDKLIESLNERASTEPGTKEVIGDILAEIESFKRAIYEDPCLEVEEDIKRLRQSNFKKEYQQRQVEQRVRGAPYDAKAGIGPAEAGPSGAGAAAGAVAGAGGGLPLGLPAPGAMSMPSLTQALMQAQVAQAQAAMQAQAAQLVQAAGLVPALAAGAAGLQGVGLPLLAAGGLQHLLAPAALQQLLAQQRSLAEQLALQAAAAPLGALPQPAAAAAPVPAPLPLPPLPREAAPVAAAAGQQPDPAAAAAPAGQLPEMGLPLPPLPLPLPLPPLPGAQPLEAGSDAAVGLAGA